MRVAPNLSQDRLPDLVRALARIAARQAYAAGDLAAPVTFDGEAAPRDNVSTGANYL